MSDKETQVNKMQRSDSHRERLQHGKYAVFVG